MLIWLQFDENDADSMSVQLHGELPKPGSVISIQGKAFAVSAVPTTWKCQGGELIPVLHLLVKADGSQS